MLQLFRERANFFWELTLEHLMISGTSILIATIIGLFLGILISQYTRLSPWVLGLTNVVYTVPSISLLGFLLPFTGIGNTTAIIALTVYALLPMIRNTYTGIREVDPDLLEAAKGMGSNNFQILVKIKLPLAAAMIMAGLRNMAVMTIALTGIASFIGAGGLGVAVYRGINTYNMALTLDASLLIAVIAFIADFLFGLLERYFNRYSRRKDAL